MPDGRLFPVDECGLNIWDIGENGNPPNDYHFTFKAGILTSVFFYYPQPLT